MKIKEVSKETGLSAKAIRMYEEKGLLKVPRLDNSYREYDSKSVLILKEIKLYRKLNISVIRIKQFLDQEISIDDLLEDKIEDCLKTAKQSENHKSVCEALIRDYEIIDREKCIEDYTKAIAYSESDAFELDEKKMKEMAKGRWDVQLLLSLLFLGPIMWVFINLSDKRYDDLNVNIIVALVAMALLTLSWTWFISVRIKYKDVVKKEYSGVTIIGFFWCIFMTLFTFYIVEQLQIFFFAPDDYIASGINRMGVYCIFFFELEWIALIFLFIGNKFKIFYSLELMNKVKNILSFKIIRSGLIVINLCVFLVCLFSVTIITEDGIHVKSIISMSGTNYSYEQVKLVESGYYNKGRSQGMFYYKLTMDDGYKIDLNDCSPNEQESDSVNSYEWIENLDIGIMTLTPEKVVDLESEQKSYAYAQKYKDLFQRILENQ